MSVFPTTARLFSLFLITALFLGTPTLNAQDTGGGDTGNGNNNNGGTDNGDGDSAASLRGAAGVDVDATGVLRMKTMRDASGRLARQRLDQMRAALDPDIARPSKLRKVSLNRLEAVLSDRIAKGAGITDDMRYLAGLTRIENVFYFPETRDIVIAGPAEGYGPDLNGRVVGLTTGQATLQLQDLIVALRAFAPDSNPTQLISCSIDPTREGLQRMREYMVAVSGRVQPSDAHRYAAGMRENLGLQVVTIQGIPATTHFAHVLVEADYRMKLIGIGLETPAVGITSFIKRANPASVARNALQRWYFVPDYESVRVSEDRLAMALEGVGVKLIGEDERVGADGVRMRSGRVDRASQVFVTSFTKRYAELARKSTVYGQLRNVIDMAIAAAYIHQEDYYAKAEWWLGVFAREEVVPVQIYNAPKEVESAVNVVWKGRTLMTPIGGGVTIQPLLTLSSGRVATDESGKLNELREEIDIRNLDPNRWWWD